MELRNGIVIGLALLLGLTSCGKTGQEAAASPTATVSVTATATPTPAPTPRALELADIETLVAAMDEETVRAEIRYDAQPPEPQKALALLRAALEEPRQVEGGDLDETLWSVTLDNAVCAAVGLTQDVVELSIPGGWRGALYLEDPALYQFIRTACDRPDEIDQAAYEEVKAVVDEVIDRGLEQITNWDNEEFAASWELIHFRRLAQRDDLGAKLYQVEYGIRAATPEQTLMLGGNGYLDSQLRFMGVGSSPKWILIVDGEAKFVSPYQLDPEWERSQEASAMLDGFESRKALLEAVGW